MMTLLGILGGLGAIVGFFLRGKLAAVQTQNAKAKIAEAIVENHAVEQKEAAAKTPEDIYAALKADRASDS